MTAPRVSPDTIHDECLIELTAVLDCYLPSEGAMSLQAAVSVVQAVESIAAEALVAAYGLDMLSGSMADAILDGFADNVARIVHQIRQDSGAKG